MTRKQPDPKVVEGRTPAAKELRKHRKKKRVVVIGKPGSDWMVRATPKAGRLLFVRNRGEAGS